MAKEKQRTSRQTRSIAKRLNGALIRRRFLAVLVADIVIALAFVVLWCGITESFYCGELALLRRRDFTNVAASVADNVGSYFRGDFRVSIEEVLEPVEAEGEAHLREVKLRDERRLPFSGVYYVFNVDSEHLFRLGNYGEVIPDAETRVTVRYGGNTFTYTSPNQVAVDSSMMLTTVLIATLGVIALQCIYYTLSQFTGRLLIKKYLRPIDDLALAAERLSSTIQAGSGESISSMRLDDVEFDEISQAIHAIDAIDDAHSRIDIPETELGGLEAAINNMLRRLDEEKLKQIRFVDDASHELRTPIAVIQGYANMLDRWGKDDPQIRDEAIGAIKTESEHMKTLIDQLLFLARGEMDRHAMSMVTLDAAELIEDVYEESVMIDADHNYTLALGAHDAQRPMILADAAMIKQAVRILRDNAAKYTPAGGSISLRVYERALSSTSKDGGTRVVCLEVSDSGVGIRPDELSRIFDRFYRGSNARTSSASGSGLGLSIAKWIVEAHGGSIEAISGVGIGTKMTVVLRARGE